MGDSAEEGEAALVPDGEVGLAEGGDGVAGSEGLHARLVNQQELLHLVQELPDCGVANSQCDAQPQVGGLDGVVRAGDRRPRRT